MGNVVKIPRKSKPDTFTAYRVDQPKPAKEPSSIDWEMFPLIVMTGFMVIFLSVAVVGGLGFVGLVLAYSLGWWALAVPVGVAAFVALCYFIGSRIES